MIFWLPILRPQSAEAKAKDETVASYRKGLEHGGGISPPSERIDSWGGHPLDEARGCDAPGIQHPAPPLGVPLDGKGRPSQELVGTRPASSEVGLALPAA
jgi:hypothetical protein